VDLFLCLCLCLCLFFGRLFYSLLRWLNLRRYLAVFLLDLRD
jgi:hypothetical protein